MWAVNVKAQAFGSNNGRPEVTAYQIYTKTHLEKLADSVAESPLPTTNWSCKY